MFETILISLFFPILVVFFHYLFIKKTNRCSMDFLPHSAVTSCVVLVLCVGFGFFAQVADREVRNGEVIGKSQETTSCSHSYPCNCTKDGCSVCHRHINDYDWVVKTNIPYTFTIARVDEQGRDEPARWTSVKIGDPVSDSFTYINYIKGAKKSLFNEGISDIDLKDVPDYPSNSYDYYHVDRVIGVGVNVNSEWNKKLQTTLSKIGPKYQVNVIVVVTNKPESFSDAIEYKWAGGKKNDVIVVINIEGEDNTIVSAKVISWTPEQLFKVELRDDIVSGKVFDFDVVLKTIETHIIKNWKRMHMREFSYLQADIDVPMYVIIGSIVVSIISYFGLFYYLTYRKSSRFIYKTRRKFF